MAKKDTPKSKTANTQNANKGNNGVNKEYTEGQGNKSKQLPPYNQSK